MENTGKQRILGLDTGTNSLGWAVVDRLPYGGYELIDKGVHIFQEGVNIEKGTVEKSRAAERTEHRSLRKIYWRRKVRKIRVLAVLSNAGLCPPLSSEELHAWRVEGIYPLGNENFMRWQRTDENKGINPYDARCQCIERELDLENRSDRYLLGRALYHITQHRGFLSNRKDQTDDKNSETGKVKEGIKDLTQKIQDAGCEYLCQYFYQLYQRGERIRSCYTDRKEHYEKEFDAICKKQHLGEALVNELRKVIFEQRPLKSQRRGVAKCPFEPSKHCAPVSHPLFEEFRMWSFIRNIKVQTPADNGLRMLTDEEINKILPLWYRKSKANFHFEDIAKTLAGKGKYCYYKSAEDKPFRFNYYLDTNVAGCPVSAQLKEIFGVEILKNRDKVDTVWHALDFFTDDVKLREWGVKHYNLTDEQADKLAQMRLPQGYASLSLKAMENIVPLMRDHGMIYPNATLVAKLRDLTKDYPFDTDFGGEVDAYLKTDIEDYLTIPTDKDGKPTMTREERKQALDNKWKTHYNLSDKDIQKLYHPSMIEEYRKVEHKTEEGVYQLDSPRISALKNPMAMRSLFRMKAVVNQLLKDGTIDENTIIHIEFARELNDANRRAALRQYQAALRKEREEAVEAIKDIVPNPSDDDILKYLLWKDQGGKCVYIGKSISLAALFNGTEFDIEHTVPRSMGGDTTRENLTICDAKFNREIKKNRLPSQLSEQQQAIVQANIEEWKQKYEDLGKQLRRMKGSTSGLSSKDAKDRVITKRHLLEMQCDFWKNKYNSFIIEEKDVQGFTRRQGTDISVISRYGRLYLLSLFNRVNVVKGTMTAAFRKIWGIQSAYEKKNRENHVHHCIDAITIACMGKREYDELSAWYHADEENRYHNSGQYIAKPWQTFTEDIKNIEREILVAHYTANPMGKQTRKKLRDSQGHIIRDKQGNPRYAIGDTARGVLHMDTQYGAIKQEGQIKYVLRMAIDDSRLKVENIVDPVVRQKVQDAVNLYGSIAKALENGPIWMNEEKRIAIKKVRVIQDRVQNPMHIRMQRDISKYEYKRQYHVKNETNYLVAIYEGENISQRNFKVVSNLDAAKLFNSKQSIVPLTDENGWHLINSLKVGDLVLLYEKTPEELKRLSQQDLVKHLFKIVGLALSGGIQIKMNYHQEARPSGELHQINGPYMFDEPIAGRRMLTHTQFNALVQRQDFEISDTGKITFKQC
ncbi:MAG: CRISPR-associated protein Csn1 [Paludibacteraceae bacterium]|nr:CRISPR-associated protein Csn1 [Paludibacteraceae bacterium]